MARILDTTYRETLQGLRKYQPFVAVIAAIVLVQVLLPAPDSSDDGVEAIDATATTAPVAGTEAATGAPLAGPPGEAAIAPAAAPAASGSAGVAAGGAAAATAGPGAAPVPSKPAPVVASGDALSAPDCNRATGYLRLFTNSWPLPCQPLWPPTADNGGATATGVTKDAIKVVYFMPEDTPQNNASSEALGAGSLAEVEETIRKYFALFNRHAELYGRQVLPIKYVVKGTGPEAERAAAIDAINKHHPFAALNGSQPLQYQMGQRKVVSILHASGLASWDLVRKHAPYLWVSYGFLPGTLRQAYQLKAEFLGKRLARRPAKWAGDPLMHTQPRKFGWLYDDAPETAADNQFFVRELAKYGVKLAATVGINASDPSQAAEQVRTAIAKFQSAGVNVVIPDSAIGELTISKAATGQRYFPEWYAGTTWSGATFFVRTLYDAQQARSLYALKSQPPGAPFEKQDYSQLYAWEYGTPPPSTLTVTLFPGLYTLFNGITRAGPRLTPFTFRDGLFGAPPAGGTASRSVTTYERSWGLHRVWPWEAATDPDFTMNDDAAFAWYCVTCRGRDELNNDAPGMLMIPEGGRRYRSGTMPTTEAPLFVPAGAVGEFSDLPAPERPAPVPNKKGCANRWACYGG